jgi:hypothetical protein
LEFSARFGCAPQSPDRRRGSLCKEKRSVRRLTVKAQIDDLAGRAGLDNEGEVHTGERGASRGDALTALRCAVERSLLVAWIADSASLGSNPAPFSQGRDKWPH